MTTENPNQYIKRSQNSRVDYLTQELDFTSLTPEQIEKLPAMRLTEYRQNQKHNQDHQPPKKD